MDPNAGNYGNNANFGGSFYDPNVYAPTDPIYGGVPGGEDYENEPPLLEGKIFHKSSKLFPVIDS